MKSYLHVILNDETIWKSDDLRWRPGPDNSILVYTEPMNLVALQNGKITLELRNSREIIIARFVYEKPVRHGERLGIANPLTLSNIGLTPNDI